MDDKAAKKRSWIKNIAIIFLALMLVLTLFSNTIMNYSLPQINAQYCYGGTITTRIRGSAKIEAKNTYELPAPSSALVKDVGIRTGDMIDVGTVLFIFEDESQGDIITAKSELASLKEEYYRLASPSSSSGDTSEYDSIYSQLVEAYTSRSLAAEAKTKAAELKAEIKQLQKQLEALTEERDNIREYIEAAKNGKKSYTEAELAGAQIRYETASAAYENAKSEEAAAKAYRQQAEANKRLAEAEYKAAREAAGDSISDTQTSITEESIRSMTRNLEDLQRAYDQAVQSYQQHYSEYTDTLNTLLSEQYHARNYLESAAAAYEAVRGEADSLAAEYDELTAELSGAPTPERAEEIYAELAQIEENPAYKKYTDYKDKYGIFEAARKEYDNARFDVPENLKAEQNALTEQKIMLDRAVEDYQRELAEYSSASRYNVYIEKIDECAALLSEASALYSDSSAALSEAAEEYNTAKALYEAASGVADLPGNQVKYDELDGKCDSLQDTIEEKNSELSELNMTASGGASDSELRRLQNALAQAKKNQGITEDGDDEVKKLRLEVLADQISAKEDEITKLIEGNYTTEVKSPVAGEVSSVNVMPGNKVSLNDILAEITVVDSGYTATINVSIEQAQRLKRGDSAEVQNYWWGETPTAVISAITVDRNNPQNRRNVVLDITGDVAPGTQMTFSIGEKAQNYDVVVPNIAIHEDNNGKFVYAIDVKSTPLGARYTTRRVDVSVIANDESQSAVSGLAGGEYVIISSSKPLSASMQVRFSE